MLIPSSPTPSVHGESEVKLGVDVPLTETATQPEPQQARTRSAGNAVVIDREEIIASIRASLDDNEKLKARNVILQNQLGEYFRRKRSDENAQAGGTSSTGDNTLSNTGGGKGGADIGNRYNAALTTLQTLHANLATLRGTHDKQSADYHEKLTLKRAEAAAKEGEFRAYKRSVALAAENSRTGKGIQVKAVEALEAGEERKDAEVVEVRLENIKLRNRLRRSEALLRQKEELADGLHLIDFEQLKIENSTYTSKIESRNESLLTLRKKITTIVQVLTHVKEKLWHTQLVARDLEAKLAELDEDVLRRRDALPGRKAVRDALRKENAELRRRAGLLGEKGLLRDFEHRVVRSELWSD
ncbi:uncharacterized protein EV422DRAFT_492799 [Fimicolochytrium jonesii]|uniref:uncharacterized protein n=1 Tax=Fimicolochytrium jonesii TaxID=1396493 RepID=UPI0022FE915A|nr:uncharacterized protein EV422DRAFT_492799 [Fimicolochytrium jonesii]KAI8825024.1 hypothetical protein EV422DRAFT_492799 [Fimicolochytrium jonesii]